MSKQKGLLVLLLALTILVACDSPPVPSPVSLTPTSTLAACVVTIPNGSVPPNIPGVDPVKTPCPGCHGNGALWTTYSPDGQVQGTPNSEGGLEIKFPWWHPGITEPLTQQARRLDAPAPPPTMHIPSGYEGGDFQATSIVFPTPGCWEVTGKAGTASLRFVVLVVKAGSSP